MTKLKNYAKTMKKVCLHLKNKYIEYLIDVRSYPGSLRVPQFNKENLQKNLPQQNIKYIHIPNLGGFRKNKPSYQTTLRVKSFASYAEYMLSKDFSKGIKE